VRYKIDNRARLGVASTFLADRIKSGDTLKVYAEGARSRCLPILPCRSS
jgi:sulfite reductase (NADPH) flavoprotein alpha-component